MVETMTISDVSSLHEWRLAVRSLWFPSTLPEVEFRLPTLSESANRQLTVEALRLHQACGCTAGGLAMTVAILLTALALANGDAALGSVPLLRWAEYLVFIVAASALGKLTGLLWARRRMVQLADSVGEMVSLEGAALRVG